MKIKIGIKYHKYQYFIFFINNITRQCEADEYMKVVIYTVVVTPIWIYGYKSPNGWEKVVNKNFKKRNILTHNKTSHSLQWHRRFSHGSPKVQQCGNFSYQN